MCLLFYWAGVGLSPLLLRVFIWPNVPALGDDEEEDCGVVGEINDWQGNPN
jgi:hypothetical protein